MKNDFFYLRYIFRHKWFVFVAGIKLNVSIWRLLVHDLSKLLPVEWIAYRNYFYGQRSPSVDAAFNAAWLHHIHKNKHHWNYWVYIDTDGTTVIPMPDIYLREMVADWCGASRAIKGRWEVDDWYKLNCKSIIFHEDTKNSVLMLLNQIKEMHLF
jgi:hypothetical protein